MESIAGTYESIEYKSKERPFETFSKRNDSKAVGTTLVLSEDSSFHMTSCANIVTGNWELRNDSVYLEYETNIWKIDSLQEFGFEGKWPKIPDSQIGYKLNGDELHRTVILLDTKKTIHFNLIKTSPNKK